MPVWGQSTIDSWVLSIIAQVYFIEFLDYPPTPTFISTPYSKLLANDVTELLQKDAIEPVPHEFRGTGFYSRYFTVPKKDGGICPIMDLRDVNVWVIYKKIHMTSVQFILPLLKKGNWMVMIDLKDTYFRITIALQHHRYLRFTVGDAHFQFNQVKKGQAK